MQYATLTEFLTNGAGPLKAGPIAMIFAEDTVELDTTIRHHRHLGFDTVLVFVDADWPVPQDLARKIIRIFQPPTGDHSVTEAVSRVMARAKDAWLFYCYNAEYLFYPFCESRSVRELLAFHTEERREAMLTFVVDLYAGNLEDAPNAVSLDDAWLDTVGYYALSRPDPENHNYPKERQLNFYGGLRWRFEEHVPEPRRKIDRVALFKAAKGLYLREDHTLSDEERNTYACPWHNNLSAALLSFRTAKALKRNPGSTYEIDTFRWRKSVPFEWHSRQLLDLGLIEPGQWF